MSKSRKKIKFIPAFISAILAISTIFPLFLNVFKAKVSGNVLGYGGSTDDTYYKLFTDSFSKTEYKTLFGFIQGTLIAALVLAVLIIAVVLLAYFGMKLRKCLLGVSVLLLLVVITTFILGLVFCSKMSGTNDFFIGNATVDFSPAVGLYIVWIGGLLSSLFGIFAGLEK